MEQAGANAATGCGTGPTLVLLLVVGMLLAGMCTVLEPRMGHTPQSESTNNLGAIGSYMVSRVMSKGGSFDIFPYDGKNFVLGPIAYRDIDIEERKNLGIFFSPRDGKYSLAKVDPARYAAIDKETLRTGDFHELTSWAGRRNADARFRITPRAMRRRTIILCDDDDGPLHHADGLNVCWSDGKAYFMDWDELGMAPPSDADWWLGASAGTSRMRALSSR